ncbi:MAG: hypothetical protein HY275_18105, partial [Gemmatimonadetes bacterium]|nr:hypothetical protein [Gemmatimonadota bacterium]
MRSPAQAIGWEFWRRQRWPLIGIFAWQLVLVVVRVTTGGPSEPIRLDPPDGLAAMVIAPLGLTYFYFLAVFSYGFAGDLSARESIFPARLRTLPVPTAALVFWPMAIGAATVALLWTLTALFARWPWGIAVPVLWPALLAAAFLMWTQALAWMPYPLRNVRVVVTVLWLASFDAIVLLALHFRAGTPVMLALVVPQLPLAYLVARWGVARARRGDTPDWRAWGAGSSRLDATVSARVTERWTPARAQAWFEWQRHGRALPALVAMVLPFELALLGLARDAPPLLFELLVLALITPPVLATFVSTSVSASNPQARDALALGPFLATRPVTSAALVAAKLRMAARSVLMTWALVLIAAPIAFTLTGTWPIIGRWSADATRMVGAPRALVALLLVLGAFA